MVFERQFCATLEGSPRELCGRFHGDAVRARRRWRPCSLTTSGTSGKRGGSQPARSRKISRGRTVATRASPHLPIRGSVLKLDLSQREESLRAEPLVLG